MRTLAVIPARGGSKGIPRKNVVRVCGKPLVGWTIEAALAAGRVDRVVVSTDDREIAAVAREFGAEVIERPAELSGDEASSEAALLHALERLDKAEKYRPDVLVFLQCTSPLTAPEDIDSAVRALLDENADSAVAVTPYHYFLWRKDEAGNAVGVNHDKTRRALRQEQEPQYLETGAVYVMRTAGFLEAKHRFFGKTAMHVMPPERCLEIDDPADLEAAELLLRRRLQKQRAALLPDNVGALVLDFDGVLTDNRVMVAEDGREAVTCDRSDGLALCRLKGTGLPILVLSAEQNPVVQARCDKLGIECIHGAGGKLDLLKKWLADRDIGLPGVVYVGNDVNDLDCLKAVGCGIAVADAYPEARSAAKVVLDSRGGHGAAREVVGLIETRITEQGNEQDGGN